MSEIKKLLDEVERDALAIKVNVPDLDELVDGIADWSLERCRRIRAGDMMAAIELGQRLDKLREYANGARRVALAENKPSKNAARLKAYDEARSRKLPKGKAYKWAAEKCGCSVKTIKRAVQER